MSALLIVAIIAVAWAWLLTFGLCRAAARKTPVPPARPRIRLVHSRDQAGIVEILPDRSELS